MNPIVVLATRNSGKIKEMNDMLALYNIEVRGLNDYPECPEVEEDGDTFEKNAIKKAETISNILGVPALADDSGLEVDALGGKPGVYSARFAGPGATDEENSQKLLETLKEHTSTSRAARFRCVLAFAAPGCPTWTCEGTCEGRIATKPQGDGGFGYDPIFYLPDKSKTMAELTQHHKNEISHRGKAIRKFVSEWPNLAP